MTGGIGKFKKCEIFHKTLAKHSGNRLNSRQASLPEEFETPHGKLQKARGLVCCHDFGALLFSIGN
jgi:hypothetical protein